MLVISAAVLLACSSSDRDGSSFGTGASATAEGGETEGSGSGPDSGPDSSGDDDSILLDVAADTAGTAGDGGGGPCTCGSQLGFSYIWIANTGQGTVSKIDTQTLVEEGRYLTRSDGTGSPSRTSVSLSGRIAAVANRNGGVIGIRSLTDECDPNKNGQAGLQTSTGKNDVLGWGQDDCVAWYTSFSYNSQRPIAWIAGSLNEATCTYSGEKLWTSGKSGFPGSVTAHLLDGADGSVELSVPVSGFDPNNYGGYGGAVDSAGNFWITNWDRADIAVIYRDGSGAQAFDHSEVGGYGITVDAEDRVWTTGSYQGGVARFDPQTHIWDIAGAGLVSATGIQQDVEGRVWTGGSLGIQGADVLVWMDPETMAVGDQLELDGFPKGISIDVDGFVWVVTFERVHKVDPDTMQVVGSYDGLDGPYTYSDMTGWALQNNTCPTPEG